MTQRSEGKMVVLRKQQGKANWLFIVALVVIVGMGIAGMYFWDKNQEEIDLLNRYVTKIEDELAAKDAAASEFQENLSKVAADMQSQDAVLNDHLRTLEETLQRVSQRLDKVEVSTSQSWLLSEVEYLLKIADYRILMKEDVKGAVALLKSADALIKRMPVEDQGLLDVRVAISKDIASLEAYRNVDVPGTYAALSALGDMIDQLPLVPTEMSDTAATEEKTGSQVLDAINDTMSGYLRIRRHDVEELKALLSPEQRINLRDSIRLMLEQAQMGLLRGDQRIYDQSLSKIRKWVHNYFVSDNFRVQIAIKKLESLIKVQVEYDLPDISGSQQALKRYLADRMRAGNF